MFRYKMHSKLLLLMLLLIVLLSISANDGYENIIRSFNIEVLSIFNLLSIFVALGPHQILHD